MLGAKDCISMAEGQLRELAGQDGDAEQVETVPGLSALAPARSSGLAVASAMAAVARAAAELGAHCPGVAQAIASGRSSCQSPCLGRKPWQPS